MPKTNTEFWAGKIARNKQRDGQAALLLRRRGWKVLRVWEHEIELDIQQAIRRVRRVVTSCME